MAAPSYQLVMRSGPTPGKVYPLEKNELFIGRDLTNDIVINDPEISRRHARLVTQAGGYVIEDLGSTNGTFVNGQRLVGPYILQPVEMLTLGEHVNLVYEAVVDHDATVVSGGGVETIPQVPPPPVQSTSTPPAPSMQTPPPQGSPYQQAQTPPPQPSSYQQAQTPPPQATPFQPATPPPSYSGQVPQGPVVSVEPPPPAKKRSTSWILVVILILLLLLCVCGAIVYVIDANSLWCKILPFIPGCS